MSDATPEPLRSYVDEAWALRAQMDPLNGFSAGPKSVQDQLLDVRRRLDRVEHLLTLAMGVRAAVAREHRTAEHAANDDWDAAAVKVLSSPVRRGDEYTSAKERAAMANLATIDARIKARQLAEGLSHCDEAVDILRTIHNGLNGVRTDALAILRLLQFESHLER